MPFFIPSQLIEFEYFSGNPDNEYSKLAKPYQRDIDFAFFAVNFGYSKADYQALTLREKMFIYKAWENKTVSETTHIRNAVQNAVANALRKKGKKAVELWKKKRQHTANLEVIETNLDVVAQVEAKEGKSWVDRIYEANGKKKRGGKHG